MGVLSRLATVIKARMSQLLAQTEDPATMLDYSYEKQRELLHNVKRGIVEVVTSRRRLELQADKLRANMTKLDGQSREAITAGREDLARFAIQRKQAAAQQLKVLESQITDLEAEQQKLQTAESRLAAKVEAFRSRKELTKAQYSAAEAQVRIGEAATGLSEEMAAIGLTGTVRRDKLAERAHLVVDSLRDLRPARIAELISRPR